MVKLYFAHDVDARNSNKLINVRMKLGSEGYAIYFMLLEKLAEAEDHRLKLDYPPIAYELHVESESVKSVIEDFGLFVMDDVYFWSEGLKERISKSKEISQKRQIAGKAGAEARWQNNSKAIANAIETDGKPMANAIEEDGKDMANAIENDGKPMAKNGKFKIKNLKFKNISSSDASRSDVSSSDIACAHAEEGSVAAEEEDEFMKYNIFGRAEKAMHAALVFNFKYSMTDDNRIRRFLTDNAQMPQTIDLISAATDVTVLRNRLEKMEQSNQLTCIPFEQWLTMSRLMTLPKADYILIRGMCTSNEAFCVIQGAIEEIGKSSGKIMMPSRYIISKLKEYGQG